MDAINTKYEVLKHALDSLGETLSFFDKVKAAHNKQQLLDDYEVVYKVARDSVIQRFEFSVELFWKYMRLFLEGVKQVRLDSNTPRDTIRAACQARVINEQVAEICMQMIRSRNLTSHMYQEDIAEQLANDIPLYYEQMKKLSNLVRP